MKKKILKYVGVQIEYGKMEVLDYQIQDEQRF